MIEHPFCSGKMRARGRRHRTGLWAAGSPARPWPDRMSKIARNRRNRTTSPGVYRAMKRDPARLLAATLRTGLLVGLALILILILLPAALAAQAAGLR